MPPTVYCHYCGREYVPDPRVKTPKACSRKRCRKARHDQAHRRYVQDNPTIYQGFYPKTLRWLKDHPGYLRDYRNTHPDYVAADNAARRRRHARAKARRADIQDEIRRRKIQAIRTLRGADIQDVMRRQIDGVLDLMAYPGSADIQDAIDAGRPWPVPCSP
jgi:hypothetical protein